MRFDPDSRSVGVRYLGVNLLTHLDADSSRTDALFERVASVGPVLEQLLVHE